MISTLQHIRLLAPPGPDTRQKLRASLIYAYSNFTTYRDLFETAFVEHEVLVGDDPFAVLERLPVISADTLARVSEESLAIVDGIVDMETSSGTTGVRKKRFISHEDDRDDHNFMAELFRVAGISAHDRVACLDTDPVYLMVSFARALDTLGVDEAYVYSVGRDQGQTSIPWCDSTRQRYSPCLRCSSGAGLHCGGFMTLNAPEASVRSFS